MSTIIKAPYPNHKVTATLPSAKFDDARASESTVTIKRSMLGRKITYVNPSDRYTVVLPFILTRMKSLELEAFVQAYQSAHWEITLYDGSKWDCLLVGEPVSRAATQRIGDNPTPGKEAVEVTLTFSAKRIS
jgi:hypothetical protein